MQATREQPIDAIQSVVEKMKAHRIFVNRYQTNILNRPQTFNRGAFWNQLVGCLCSTQERVSPGAPAIKLLESKPFPLSLEICQQEADLENYARGKLTHLHYGSKIAHWLATNLDWLERRGGWSEIERESLALANIPGDALATECIQLERHAVEVARKNLDGIGPKQSRNLWICLGFTRFEIPIDSRVMEWFSKLSPPVEIDAKKIGQPKYYEKVQSEIQDMCQAANELPCLVDAAIFASLEKSPDRPSVAESFAAF
jgi:hypothetical protein